MRMWKISHCSKCSSLSLCWLFTHQTQWHPWLFYQLVEWCIRWCRSRALISDFSRWNFANTSSTTDEVAESIWKLTVVFDSSFSRTLFDIKVFNLNPYAQSCQRGMPDSWKYHKSIKKLKKESKSWLIEIQKYTFCPLIFSCISSISIKSYTEVEFNDQQ